MPVKVQLNFNFDRFGFAESWLDLNSTTLEQGAARGIVLGKARLGLAATSVYLRSVVVSQELRPGTAATTGDSLTADLTGNGTAAGVILFDDLFPGVEDTPDFGNMALEVEMASADGRYRANKELGGCPDLLFRMNPPGPDIDRPSIFKQQFNKWKTSLLNNGWGFWRRDFTPPTATRQSVIALQQQGAPPSLWGVVTDAAGPAIPVKAKVQLRGFRHFTGAIERWQGFWYVDSVVNVTGPPATRVYYLRNSSQLDAADVTVLGSIEAVFYTPQGVERVTIKRQMTRKRGVGSGRPVGRSRPRRT